VIGVLERLLDARRHHVLRRSRSHLLLRVGVLLLLGARALEVHHGVNACAGGLEGDVVIVVFEDHAPL